LGRRNRLSGLFRQTHLARRDQLGGLGWQDWLLARRERLDRRDGVPRQDRLAWLARLSWLAWLAQLSWRGQLIWMGRVARLS
jgi:hypothetical protein